MGWFWIYVFIYWNELIYIKFISSDIFTYKDIHNDTQRSLFVDIRHLTKSFIFLIMEVICKIERYILFDKSSMP